MSAEVFGMFGRRAASLAVTVVVIDKTLVDLVPTIFILILVVGGAMELVGRVR